MKHPINFIKQKLQVVSATEARTTQAYQSAISELDLNNVW